MKRFFWAKFREENGDSWARKHKNSEADFWYRMAQKPIGSTIHIPQRQFIGESRELDKKIEQAIDKEIEDFNNLQKALIDEKRAHIGKIGIATIIILPVGGIKIIDKFI